MSTPADLIAQGARIYPLRPADLELRRDQPYDYDLCVQLAPLWRSRTRLKEPMLYLGIRGRLLPIRIQAALKDMTAHQLTAIYCAIRDAAVEYVGCLLPEPVNVLGRVSVDTRVGLDGVVVLRQRRGQDTVRFAAAYLPCAEGGERLSALLPGEQYSCRTKGNWFREDIEL